MSITRIEFWKRYRPGVGALGHRRYTMELRVFRSRAPGFDADAGSGCADCPACGHSTMVSNWTQPEVCDECADADEQPADVQLFLQDARRAWRDRGHTGPPPWSSLGGGDEGPPGRKRVVKRGTLRLHRWSPA